MAIKFADTKGSAQKNSPDAYKYVDGENVVRIIGDVLPRYIYWLKGSNNKDIPVECLSFDREKERFTNVETDHVRAFYPEVDSKGKHVVQCAWAYAVNCIDPKDGKVKVLNLKKKLFGQIIEAANDLGDPTDLDNGWDINFKKVKTGPLPFNVEYQLNVLRCKKRPLTDEERVAVEAAKSIEELIPRPTADEVLALLNRIKSGASEDEDDAPQQDASTAEAIADL